MRSLENWYLCAMLILNTNMINLLKLEVQAKEQELTLKARSFNIADEFPRMSGPGVSSRLITDIHDGGHRLVDLSQDSDGQVLHCNAFGSKDVIDTMLTAVSENAITKVTKDEMDQFVNLCDNPQLHTTKQAPKSILNFLSNILHRFVIYPGTKWCGEGTLAKDYDDLGTNREVDMCCREHDHATDYIKPFQKKHGIRNWEPYTITNCEDDCKLYNCMKNVNSSLSKVLGVFYFSVVKMRCFAYDYPLMCTSYNRFYIPLLTKRCKKYEPDTSKPKAWAIFTQPNFLEVHGPRICRQLTRA
ncbi:uncharacterized protein LOC8035532 [Ixodes scapularis]|nr:uncharacterized protein LOC8035532 [Ixodes scapularis]